MKFQDLSGTATVAHKVFDTGSARETQHKGEGDSAQYLLDSVPDLRGRVLHVTIHQVQQYVPTEVVCDVFSEYGEVAEMFQSPPFHSNTQALSFFIEYEHGTNAATALHDLHGVCLYPNDCQLDIRHATLKELHTFYGYSAPRFSEEQFELLQQIQRDLKGLKKIVTCLAPTPPTRLIPSVDVCSASACVSEGMDDQQAEPKCKQHEQNLRQVPAQLQFELKSLHIPGTISLDVESATEEQLQESSSPTLGALSVATPILPEVSAQSDDQVENLLTSVAFQLRQPEPPLVHGSNWKQETPSQMQLPHMLALVPCSSNAQESSANNSDLCGHIKNTPLMLPWDPGTQFCAQRESNGQTTAPDDNEGTDEKHKTQGTDGNEENCMINQMDMLTDECPVKADAMLKTDQNCSKNLDLVLHQWHREQNFSSACGVNEGSIHVTATGLQPRDELACSLSTSPVPLSIVVPVEPEYELSAIPTVPVPQVLDVSHVTTSADQGDDTPQGAQGSHSRVVVQLTISSDFANTLEPVAAQPQSRLEMFRKLESTSLWPIVEEVCTSLTGKRKHLLKLDNSKPGLFLELHLLSLAIMRNEAVLWPIIQSATCNDILLQPWDPGRPLFGMVNKMSTVNQELAVWLPTARGGICWQGHSVHELCSCNFVLETILNWMAKLMELQPWPSWVLTVMVALVQLQPESSSELSILILTLARCARYIAWIWRYLGSLHYIHESTSLATPYFGMHIPSPEFYVLMYCHFTLGTSSELAPCLHIWVSKGLVPMCYGHLTRLLVQYADINSKTSWQQWRIVEQHMTEPWDPGDDFQSNVFTDQPTAPITISDWTHLLGVQPSRLEPIATTQVSTFLTNLKVERPWDPGVLKHTSILDRAYYPATFSWSPSIELIFHCNLILLAWTLLNVFSTYPELTRIMRASSSTTSDYCHITSSYDASLRISKLKVVRRSKVQTKMPVLFISTLTTTTYQDHIFEANFTQFVSEYNTWDPGITTYRTLQPDSDTYLMDFTCQWTKFTTRMVGLQYKTFSCWIMELWIISFKPP